MGAKFSLGAAKKGAISSPANPLGSFPSDWLLLRRSGRVGRYEWVISIPKKVIPASVRRSRIKRLVREALRVLRLQPPPGTQWRFSVKSDPPKTISMQDVADVIRKLAE